MDLPKLYSENEVERRRISRERRDRDVEKIRERNALKPLKLEAFPIGTFERLKKYDIWGKILPFLTDSVDIENTYRTCPPFQLQSDLHEKRLTNLLPEVLRVIEERPEEQAIQIQKMRLISKRTKRAVESEFFERPFTHNDWHLSYEFREVSNSKERGCCTFSRVDQVERAISALGQSDSGHCFIRSLQILGDRYEDTHSDDVDIMIDYFNKILEFLDVHGHAVWGLCYLSCAEIQSGYNYEVLRQITRRTPNLKAFSLKTWKYARVTSDYDAEEIQDFLEELQNHPFPQIPSLKYFDFDFTPNFYEPFISHFLRINDQIKTLRFLRWNEDDPLRESFTSIENEGRLVDLKLEKFEGPFYSWKILSQAEWPLKVLHLYLDKSSGSQFEFQDSDLFPELNRFGNTLKELSLEDKSVKKVELSWGFCGTKLDLPHLKRLKLFRDVHEKSRRYYLDRAYYIALPDLVGLKAVEKLEFQESLWPKPNYKILSKYFKAFPQLKEIEVPVGVVYKRVNFK